ncbi:D-alanyl-D-alanine carboxypeptidase/D-alanyl-D-alanine-endopeptidase [Parasulfuritortus cantonensis]|uniref:D-alanyl-D-alanine carboxypeptidase/D-alanyl-D-alanine-endopeptidase n=1 Tax=Parasulfuritortus cantonensis TaxID=2528202 RepID=A0A4V2NVT9_9PROT|nr:D-alanyl-D-alanine carboxypeptidase/D-alanyl-D-alanine-endopeptidase [Parasulfuritortus cantonensis]TCJ14752.1 D-alanyl-D-alanine carboxypeptidase/D-alanyl-D-alanine-endopeptidase [Parasulfuritortus cantonensis]
MHFWPLTSFEPSSPHGLRRHLWTAILGILLAFAPGLPAQADDLPGDLQAALGRANIPEEHIGVVVQDLANGVTEVAFGGHHAFNPASVMKLLTTLVALDTLGPGHTFKTQVLVDGTVNNGVLHGNLVLRGGGDPALNVERFWLLLRAIQARGIRVIDGDVVFDDSYYAVDLDDPGEFDAAPLKPYNAAPVALLVNYNAVALHLRPANGGVEARLDPPGLTVDNRLAADPDAACDAWQDRLDMSRDGDTLVLSGAYPVACADQSTWLNLMCPPATAAAYFNDLWRELGGRHAGQVRLGETPESARPLLEFESPPLAEIVRGINKFSNNVMAKMLYLDLGAIRLGGAATWEKSDRAVRDWLAEKGLAMPELVLENGSGLSRIERISAGSMARLLVWAAGQPIYYEFAASLPALGEEGTQQRRMRGEPEAGRAWLKSGTLNGARNLAGYILDAAGHRKVVVLFINHPGVTRADLIQAAVLRHAINALPPALP